MALNRQKIFRTKKGHNKRTQTEGQTPPLSVLTKCDLRHLFMKKDKTDAFPIYKRRKA
jgi:hypothetical protein